MKVKRLLTLALTLALVLALCACGKKAEQETPDAQTAGEEETLREESAEQKALRGELEAAGEAALDVGELSFFEPLVIEGTKTLTGGTLSAEETTDCLIVVPDGASLILDGVMLDGGGNAKAGVRVEKGGSLKLLSGSIENATRQGVRTEGKVSIEGGSIAATGANWLYCAKGSEVSISGGEFLLSDDVGVTVFAGAKLSVSGGSFENAGNATIFNRGSADITGGTITASGNYALSNENEMSVKNLTVSGSLDRGDIYNFAGATLRVEDTLLTGAANYAIYNNGEAELVRVTMENTGASSINNQTQTAHLTLTDSSISGAGSNGIYNKDAFVTLHNVTITNSDNHAIYNRAGSVSADGLTMRTAKGTVVCNDAIADGESVYGSMSLKNFTVGGAEGYGVSSYGGALELAGGTVEKSGSYCVYVKGGTAALDGVTLRGTTEAGRAALAIGAKGYTGAKVTASNVNISGAGRGISNHGTLTLNSGVISGNTGSGELNYGGGVYNFNVFTMNGGTITGNTAQKGGGGFCNDGTAYLNGGVITGNTAGTHGGGVYNTKDGRLTMNGVQITGNAAGKYAEPVSAVTAMADGGAMRASLVHADEAAADEGPTSNGGGVYNLGSVSVGAGTVIADNTAAKNGGGFCNSGTAELAGTIRNNRAGENGGGIYNGGAAVSTLSAGTVEGNGAGKNGGGLYLLGTASVSGTSFAGNRALGNGAGIYVTSAAKLTVKDSRFTGNSADKGGGIYLYHNTNEALLQNVTMSGNSCSGNGTGVYSNSGIVHFIGGSYSGSGAKDEGYTVHSYQAEGEAVPVYRLEGRLNIDSIYVTANGNIELTNPLEQGSSVGIRLNSTKDISKRVILVGDPAVISASAAACSVINTSQNFTYQIKDSGMGGSTAIGGGGGGGGGGSRSNSFTLYGTDTAEAVIAIHRGEQTIAEGLTLRNAVSQASSGDTLVLCGDITLTGNVSIGKQLTLTDDGSARTITVDTASEDACYAPFFVGSSLTVEPSETGSLSIVGADNGEDGENMGFTVFYVNKSASLTLHGITVSGLRSYGLSGGDNKNGTLAYCYMGGKVTLDGVSVSDCRNLNAHAGVVHNYQGTVTLKNSTFTNNSAAKGGGVVYASEGKVTAEGCTFKGNRAGTYGGVIYNSKGQVEVKSCVFGAEQYANTCGNIGRDIYANGALTLTGETRSFDLGLGSDGSLVCGTLFTVPKGNQITVTFTAAAFAACVDGSKSVITGGSESSKTVFAVTNDSYYFDADGCLKTDAQPWLSLGGESYVSLQSAVNAAKAGDTVYITGDGVIGSATTLNKALTLTASGGAHTVTLAASKALTVDAVNVVICGAADSPLTFKGAALEPLDGDAAIYVSKSKSLTLRDLTVDGILNDASDKNGAAIYALGTVTLENVTVKNCASAHKQGAALYITSSGAATLKNCTVMGNSSFGSGGAINVYGSTAAQGALTLDGSTVTGNTTETGIGADIYSSGAVSLADSAEQPLTVGRLYLADGRTVTAAAASANAETGVGIGMVTFAAGETVLTGSGAESFAARLTVLNNAGISVDEQEVVLCTSAGGNLGKLIANPELKVARIGETTYCSLSEAVAAAEDGDTIVLTHDATVGDTIVIDKNLTLKDDGTARTLKLNAANTAYSLNVSADKTLTLTTTAAGGLTLTRSEGVVSKRAAIYALGSVNVSGKVTFRGIASAYDASTAANCGGVFCLGAGASVSLDGTAFSDCSAAANKGAAAYVGKDSSVTLKNVTMDGKTVAENGGDIYSNGSVTVDGRLTGVMVYLAGSKTVALASGFDADSAVSVTFTDNAYASATGSSAKVILTGEGVADKYTCFTITNGSGGCFFAESGKVATLKAAAIAYRAQYSSLAEAVAAAQDGDTIVLHANVTLNSSAKISVGGENALKTLTVTDDGLATRKITINNATAACADDGGSLTIRGSKADRSGITVTTASSNNYLTSGSALNAAEGGSLVLEDLQLDLGKQSAGFGTAVSVGGTVQLDNVLITSCTANASTEEKHTQYESGAAVYVKSTGALTANGCEFTDCSSAGNGGAIYITSGGSADFTDCGFSDNTTGKLGADIYSNGTVRMGGKMTVQDICLAKNKTVGLTEKLGSGSSVSVSFTTGAWDTEAPAAAILTDTDGGVTVAASYGYFLILGHDDYCFADDGTVAQIVLAELLPEPVMLPAAAVTGEESAPSEEPLPVKEELPGAAEESESTETAGTNEAGEGTEANETAKEEGTV